MSWRFARKSPGIPLRPRWAGSVGVGILEKLEVC